MAKSATPPLATAAPSSEDSEDYMSMTITEPIRSGERETYTQRRTRKQREAEARSHPKSKAELAAAADAARNDALSTALPNTSKGFQMMAKFGFKPGAALGASSNPNARTEPLSISFKEDRGGVGMLHEKKRKFRDEVEGFEKKHKAEEEDYRDRISREREEKRVEGMFGGAMRVLEGLEQPEGGDKVPIKRVNLLWRGLVRERREKERERRARYDLHQSLLKCVTYEGADEDEQDRQALGKEEEDVDEDDEELDGFLGMEGKERLRRLVEYLRQQHQYCFWCKFKYEDEKMEGCPGLEEDDHD